VIKCAKCVAVRQFPLIPLTARVYKPSSPKMKEMLDVEYSEQLTFEQKYIAKSKCVVENPYLAVENTMVALQKEMDYYKQHVEFQVVQVDNVWRLPRELVYSPAYSYSLKRGKKLVAINVGYDEIGGLVADVVLQKGDVVQVLTPQQSFIRFIQMFGRNYEMTKTLSSIIHNESVSTKCRSTDMTLNLSQMACALHILQHSLTLVQGPPGTGKTMLIREVVRRLCADGERVLCTAASRAGVFEVLKC